MCPTRIVLGRFVALAVCCVLAQAAAAQRLTFEEPRLRENVLQPGETLVVEAPWRIEAAKSEDIRLVLSVTSGQDPALRPVELALEAGEPRQLIRMRLPRLPTGGYDVRLQWLFDGEVAAERSLHFVVVDPYARAVERRGATPRSGSP